MPVDRGPANSNASPKRVAQRLIRFLLIYFILATFLVSLFGALLLGGSLINIGLTGIGLLGLSLLTGGLLRLHLRSTVDQWLSYATQLANEVANQVKHLSFANARLMDSEGDLQATCSALSDAITLNQAVMDGMGSGLVIFNDRGKIVGVNQAWQRFIQEVGPNVGPLEVGGTYLSLEHLYQQGETSSVIPAIQAALTGERWESRLSLSIPIAGQPRFFSLQITRLLGLESPRVVFCQEDITSNRWAEVERAAALRRYTSLVGAMGDVTYEIHLYSRRIQWEGDYTALLGYDNETMGRDLAIWRQRVHPDDLARFETEFSSASREQRRFEMEYRVHHAQGHYLWIQDRASFIYTDDQTPLLALGVMKDVTSRHQREETLQQEKTLAQSYLDQVGVMILVLHPDGTVGRANQKACEVLDYPEEVLVGSQWFEQCVPPSQRLPRAEYFAQVMKGERRPPENHDSLILTRQGEERLISWSQFLIRDQHGQIKGLLTAGEDITERRYLEEALWERAGMAQRAKSSFLAHMSHELRTPLTALLGFAEILQDHSQSEEKRTQAIKAVLDSGHHLRRLIEDVLELSQAEEGELGITIVPLDLGALLDDWLTTLTPLASAKGLELSVHTIPPLPTIITSDPHRLRQILHKLGHNAIKFTERGSVHLLASCDVGAERLVLSVFDTGTGIAPEQAKQLFKPFTQVDGYQERRHTGMGLGLYLAMQLARRLGGDLTFQSHLGVGSVFVITVATGPLDDLAANLPSPLTDLVDPMESPMDSGAVPRVAGRILLAEDNEYNQALLTHHLAKTGAEVVVVGNGELAISKALEEEFHLILMDMQMPVMGGLEATRLLREALCPLPIVAVTAHGLSYHRQEALEAGCTDYLTKPLDWPTLYRVVARYLPSASDTNEEPMAQQDDEALQALAARFRTSLPATLTAMEQAMDLDDLLQVAGLAHQIKGVASGLGYPELGLAARTAETAARSGDKPATSAALIALYQAASR